MKRHKSFWLTVGSLLMTTLFSSAYSDDLMQVYSQALASDPIFAQAKSTWDSQKMNLPIAEAGYLPQLSVQANATRNTDQTDSTVFIMPTSNSNWTQYGYTLTLTQPIFNFGAWASIKNASATVKAATATYLSAQQSLMQRTAQAYFNVLQAYDQLRYTIANKRAVWQQYVTAREQFRVGLIAITDEYDARSSYDQVVAQQINAQNTLNIQLENLRAITGRNYASLRGLGRLPLSRPQPDNIDQWVTVANQQNYALQAQNYTVIAAMETIKQQAAGGYPQLSAQGIYTNLNVSNSPVPYNDTQTSAGLALTYNPIQGGLVVASTKQARYNYVTAAGLLEQTYRSVVNQTRTSFLTVLSEISQVQADKQRIISAKNAFSATQAGFHVGTRTMVDVLNALTTLYQAQQQFANDQYAYINNIIALKTAAGTLSVNDLREINAWLGRSIRFPEQLSVAKVPTENDGHQLIANDKTVVVQPMPGAILPKQSVIEPQQTVIKPAPPAPLAHLIPPRNTLLPQPANT